MSDAAPRRAAFRPPPHLNAEIHPELMRKFEAMTPDEFLELAVRVGICNPDGTLTASYAPGEVKPPSRPTATGRRRPSTGRAPAVKGKTSTRRK